MCSRIAARQEIEDVRGQLRYGVPGRCGGRPTLVLLLQPHLNLGIAEQSQ